jgi:4a-hydroxytetrahydrobiopterin dehydratase
MLARHLKQLRAAKVVETSQAASALGHGWTENQGAFKRDFVFGDFTEASHFLERYSEYCQKVNIAPQWSNVYNRVSVTLANKEFGGVTRKEVAAGSFLNMVSKVTIN